MGEIGSAYKFSFWGCAGVPCNPGPWGGVGVGVAAWMGLWWAGQELAARPGAEVVCPHPRPEVANCVLGCLESSKSQVSQVPRVKDFPQMETLPRSLQNKH